MIYDLIIYHVRSPIPTTKVLLFFDMSDHKIVGGCSTLLAKSNKKCIFRDQGLVYIKKMLYLCSDFKSSLSSGPPSGERKKYLITIMNKDKNPSFLYGVSVGGNNFTDRVRETRRLKLNFENGLNVILISPRRMGKTSLVKHVAQVVDKDIVQIVYMDIYDCRSEYDFYNKFAEAIMTQTGSKIEHILENIRQFLTRISPKISMNPDPGTEYSVSLGITPKEYSPEEILSLPERVGEHIGKHLVVCIDEFQQVGEWPESLLVQKRMRGVWQHHTHASYCLFGSRQHMMNQLFQNKRMPFYQFGEPNYLQPIPSEEWIPFIQSKFEQKGLAISDSYVRQICEIVGNQSSYVQQLSWNVMLNTEHIVDDEAIKAGINDLLIQCTPLFMEQTGGLTSYQLNMLRAIVDGQHTQWSSQEVLAKYNLGTKSNVSKMQKVMLERDLIISTEQGLFLSDPVMELWFKHR